MGSGPSQEEKTQAMISWVLSILTGFVGPLIFFLIAGDKPFVKRHAAMALGLNIALFIVVVILIITVIGALLAPLVGLAALVFGIMGAMAANKGEKFDVPGVGPMIAKMFNV